MCRLLPDLSNLCTKTGCADIWCGEHYVVKWSTVVRRLRKSVERIKDGSVAHTVYKNIDAYTAFHGSS